MQKPCNCALLCLRSDRAPDIRTNHQAPAAHPVDDQAANKGARPVAAALAANLDASLGRMSNASSFVIIGTAMPPRSHYMPRNRAELMWPYEVSTVKDVLDLPAWPYGRLHIVIEQ